MTVYVSLTMKVWRNLEKDNQDSLDKINNTVNEKLQKTLDDKISKSFEAVNKRLAEVYEGLGEMKKCCFRRFRFEKCFVKC